MNLPPRWLVLRVVVWLGVLAWAVWLMRQPVLTQDLARVEPVPPPGPPDAGQVLVALEAIRAAGCPETGTLHVRVGSAGLEKAWIEPAIPSSACLSRATWSQTWPALPNPLEMEWALTR